MSIKEPRTEPRIVSCYYCETEMKEPSTRKASNQNDDIKFWCGKCENKPKKIIKKVKLIKIEVKSCLQV